eukprot:EC716754.1.p1 GENE.EC716754.1~~EC716754.1.p1  ORF type:complete len:245 (+),score=39.53 EC716754.1:59-736(+)
MASSLSSSAGALQSSPPLRYMAIGASDAVGIGARDPAHDGWVPRFRALLGAPTVLLNTGVSGSVLSQALREQLPKAAAFRPDIATLWMAVNDFNSRVPVEDYKSQLETALNQLRSAGARRVLVGNIPDLTRVPIYRLFGLDLVSREVARWNTAIQDTIHKYKSQQKRNDSDRSFDVKLVDLHKHWKELGVHPEYVSLDGFHPSSDGYARLAEIFFDAYREASDSV